MNTTKSLLICLAMMCLVASPLTAQVPKVEPPRAWTTLKGQTFNATLLSFDGTTAVFRMPNGSAAQAPAKDFDAAAQKLFEEWVSKQPIKFSVPESVAVDTAKIKAEVVSEDDAKEKYVYRTDNFEFTSQGKFSVSLLRDVSRTFEATYLLLKALPWGIDPKPPSGTHFKASLLKNRDHYINAGGMANSGGFYNPRTQTFYTPFESLGLKFVAKTYKRDADYTADVLVHELTHQMMHHWLDHLPSWIVEGTAEYTENLPLNAGRFRVNAAKSGLKDYTELLKRRAVGGIPDPWPIDQLFKVSNREWGNTLASNPTASGRMYFTSYLLVYYFMHMDGAGDSQRFIRYFRSVDRERKKDAPYLGEKAEAAFHAKMLDILLDGRSETELMEQIRTAYAKLGIKL